MFLLSTLHPKQILSYTLSSWKTHLHIVRIYIYRVNKKYHELGFLSRVFFTRKTHFVCFGLRRPTLAQYSKSPSGRLWMSKISKDHGDKIRDRRRDLEAVINVLVQRSGGMSYPREKCDRGLFYIHTSCWHAVEYPAGPFINWLQHLL